MPEESSLRGVPTFRSVGCLLFDPNLRTRKDRSAHSSLAGTVESLMSLLASRDATSVTKASQVWLGGFWDIFKDVT